eukprot:7834044-Pyramimonas_sp.AAC.1
MSRPSPRTWWGSWEADGRSAWPCPFPSARARSRAGPSASTGTGPWAKCALGAEASGASAPSQGLEPSSAHPPHSTQMDATGATAKHLPRYTVQ